MNVAMYYAVMVADGVPIFISAFSGYKTSGYKIRSQLHSKEQGRGKDYSTLG